MWLILTWKLRSKSVTRLQHVSPTLSKPFFSYFVLTSHKNNSFRLVIDVVSCSCHRISLSLRLKPQPSVSLSPLWAWLRSILIAPFWGSSAVKGNEPPSVGTSYAQSHLATSELRPYTGNTFVNNEFILGLSNTLAATFLCQWERAVARRLTSRLRLLEMDQWFGEEVGWYISER